MSELADFRDFEGVMPKENGYQAREWHEKFAIELFNMVWGLRNACGCHVYR